MAQKGIKNRDVHVDYHVKKTIVGKMWLNLFPCFVTVDGQGFLEYEDLGKAGKLVNAHRLFEPPPTYPEDMAELYDWMPSHFGPAVELRNLEALSSALVRQ